MSSARAAQLCPDAIWAKPHFERYTHFSEAVRGLFRDESPYVQPVSVDEAYLDVTPGRYASDDPIVVARRIQTRVDELGLTCSVGLATSKTVAKIASDREKPRGLTVVIPGDERAFLAPLSVGVLPGVGPTTRSRLARAGIKTLGDLAEVDTTTAEQLMGSYGCSLVTRARGLDDRDVRENEPRKSVSNERTFSEDLHDRDEVAGVVDALAARVSGRLRRGDLAGRTVSAKVRYGDFTTRGAQRTLDEPASDERTIASVARELVESLWSEGVGVRLLGVGVAGFDGAPEQLTLAEDDGDERDRMSTLADDVDSINERFGDDAVTFGVRRKKLKQRYPEEKT
jgi:DNA polymerase-4